MRHVSHSLLWLLGACGAVTAFAASCASVDAQEAAGAGGTCVGVTCSGEDAGRDQIVADVPPPDSAPDAAPPKQNPLCGAGCLPDEPNSAECSAAAAGGAESDPDGAPPDAGQGDGSPDADFDAAVPPPTKYGCGVVSTAGGPVSQCLAAGTGENGSPCVAASDCSPGLACVSEGTTATCRPYCCSYDTTCGADSFCAERNLAEPTGGSGASVPVCVPADHCNLAEPSPCPAGKACKCKDGTACAVVKDDGTTSCVKPGEGRAGEACPCAAGYVCSQSIKTCLKLCSTQATTPECGTGKCVAVAGLPEGFGVCGLGSLGDGG